MDRKTREFLLRESEKKSREDLAAEALRKKQRLTEEDDIKISVLSVVENIPQEKIDYRYSKDISASGLRIQGNVLLPLGTLLNIDLTLRNLQETLSLQGKVQWNKTIIENEIYEAGVEFTDVPEEVAKKIEDYIVWKQEYKKLNPVGLPFWIYAKFNKPNP
ncbi:MAG TPA: PilZ domain-containing protein [Smithella sp.]|nr:PilZ domain-containing protein [Smithella sp.]HRS97646.1 PilZ domain-containing protein [Smithella sp.]